jgi:predicted RecA/RadA family phage recombinase
MKNFIQHGDTITLVAPYNVTSGGGVLVGSIFGIACNDAPASTEMEAKLTGVFSMQKVATESWSVGSLVYWNDTEKLATSVAVANQLIGVAIVAAASPSSIGIVRLNGVFVGAAISGNGNVGKIVPSEQTRIYNTTVTEEANEE